MTTPPSNNPFEPGSTPQWEQPNSGQPYTPQYGQAPLANQPMNGYPQGQAPYAQPGGLQPYPQQIPGAPTSLFPLRPLGVGETFDAAMRIIRFNPMGLVVVPMLIWLIALVVNALTGVVFDGAPITDTNDPQALSHALESTSSWPILINLLVGGLMVALMTGAAMRATAKGALGRKVNFAEASADAGRGAGRTMLHALLFQILVTVVVVVIFGALFFAMLLNIFSDTAALKTSQGAATVIGSILAFFAIVFLLVILLYPLYSRLFVVYPVIVIERKNVFSAIGRSWQLTRGSTGHLILLGLGTLGICIAGAIVFGLIGSLFSIGLLSGTDSTAIGIIVGFITSVLGSIIFVPFFLAIQSVLYVNMRLTREGVTPAAYVEA